jgi:4,5:9,10-diseco-3-hydroxy-5,9,17-trioxoandrosta-1(10),2-diene-4-oate hydrolase
MRRLVRVGAWTAAGFALLLGTLAWYDRAAPPPAPWLAGQGLEARYETVDGRRLRYVRAGRGSPVVLVHGFGSSLATWKDVIPDLARDHDVVALDLPGFGLSDQPADLSVDDLPRAVLGLMDRLSMERAALVGNSLGGAASVLVAGSRPDRVSALVLVDAAGFSLAPTDRPRLVRWTMGPAGALLARLPGKRVVVEAALRQVFHDPRLVTPERVAEYLQGAMRPGSFASVRSLGESLRGRASVVKDALAHVTAPTLVVWGADDRWIPIVDADRFVAAIAGARKVVIPDCGHVPQEEKPERVAEVLRGFLAPGPSSGSP